MRLLIVFILLVFIVSCSGKGEQHEEIKNEVPQRAELSKDSKIFFGNRLFSEKTCITCHATDKMKIGPSIVDIMKVYIDKNASIESFLKGDSEPIVDTTHSQVTIMQANIDGFLKEVTDEELNAIATYMHHVLELKSE